MGVLSNINYIKKVFAHPCATPDIPVLIETAFPAAAMALMEVFMFGCRDIQKMRAGRSPWHSRGLNALLKKKNLGVKVGPVLWVFTAYTIPVEAALQYWLFADVATGFIANWMSMIYQVSNCTLPSAGYLSCGVQSQALFEGQNTILQILCTETRPCVLVGGDRIRVEPGCSATISWVTKYQAFLNDPAYYGSVTTWLQDRDTGEQYSVSEAHKSHADTSDGGGGVSVRAPFPGLAREFVLWARNSHGIMFCNNSTVHISAYGRKMEILPTGCKPIQYDQPYPHKPVPEEHEAKHGRPGNFFGVGGTIGGH